MNAKNKYLWGFVALMISSYHLNFLMWRNPNVSTFEKHLLQNQTDKSTLCDFPVYIFKEETNSTSDCYINYSSCCKIYCCLQIETVLVLFCLCFNSLCPFRNALLCETQNACYVLLSPLWKLASNCSLAHMGAISAGNRSIWGCRISCRETKLLHVK